METATLPIVHPKLAGCDGQGGCGPDCVYRKMAEADPEKRQHFARLLAEQNAPGFLRRAGNFAKAATQHLIAGRPEVDAATKAARLAACESCPTHYVPERRQCNHPSCGCNLDAKAGWADQDCPIGRWPPAILLTGGIGDTFALEAMMPLEERERLGTIFYACPAVPEIKTLWQAAGYPKLRHHIVLPTGAATYHNRAAVERHAGPIPGHVTDWSIEVQFPRRRPYIGSSFLARKLADVELPPAPYVVIVPTSSWFRPEGRPFDAADWQRCLAFLDQRQLTGVVLFREKWEIPSHPRLLDWQGRMSILQSIEILKAAAGYLGIDSALSVLAAKLFPANRLAIKATWSHSVQWRHVYYAPRQEFPFLQRELRPPTWD